MLINGRYRCAGCTNIIESDYSTCVCGHDNRVNGNHVHCLATGTVLAGKYYIGKVIGEGGFGITYVGWDAAGNRKVAIKEFYLNGFSSRNSLKSANVIPNSGEEGEFFKKYREKFVVEAQTLNSFVNEPGIVTVFDFFRENNTAYIVMEFIEGKTLKQYLTTKKRLSCDETLGLIGPMLNSLAKVHERNLVHRDISPDNIMITSDGRGILIDFGAAREATTGSKSISVVLKHGYAPVEQYQSHGKQGAWTDVYALSATMYRCITGVVPIEAIERAAGKELQSPHSLVPECNELISNVIMKGLSVNVADRYSSVGEMKNAVMSALNGWEPVSQQQRALGYSGIERNSSNSMLMALKIAAVTITLIILLVTLMIPSVMTIILMVGTIVSCGIILCIKPSDNPQNYSNLMTANRGEIISFGNYFGETEWYVLQKKEGRLLLLTKNVIQKGPINSINAQINWIDCSLRGWLNTDFYNATFDNGQKRLIDNTVTGQTNYGSPVADRVFLLSPAEARRYMLEGSQYMCATYENSPSWWWLRSAGYGNRYPFATNKGMIIDDDRQMEVSVADCGVRPAVWVKLPQ